MYALENIDKLYDHNAVVCFCNIIKLRVVFLIRILHNYSQISDIYVEHYIRFFSLKTETSKTSKINKYQNI